MRKLKGFALRRPGRPKGSKSFQGAQNDFWPVEKLLSQCGWGQAARSRPERSEDAPQPPSSQKRLYVPVTRKVSLKNETFGLKRP